MWNLFQGMPSLRVMLSVDPLSQTSWTIGVIPDVSRRSMQRSSDETTSLTALRVVEV